MRKMAYVVQIDDIMPHNNADALELAKIHGWQVVVKKDEYRAGDFAVYCEIDSWIPHAVAPFLTKPDSQPKVYENVPGQKLKTVKLRGQFSQGLLLPLSVLPVGTNYAAGQDVSEQLGIIKWEAPIDMTIGGEQLCAFPGTIQKTDQERVQNYDEATLAMLHEHRFEVTEKLDGMSATFWLDEDGKIHACSRNFEMKTETERPSAIARFAIARNLAHVLDECGLANMAFQGELIGPAIQSNKYKLKEHHYRVFNVWDMSKKCHVAPGEARWMTDKVARQCAFVDYVPVLYPSWCLPRDNTVQALLEMADGKSRLVDGPREGLVFKSTTDWQVHFKAISNAFLLKN